jgi:electron transfer flavoprotein alpha subunit
MGDVLVYMEESAREGGGRLLTWARPLAQAAGGELLALIAGSEVGTTDGLGAADIVLDVQHPALSPYIPEAHQAVLIAAIEEHAPDLVLIENTTVGLDLAAAVAAATDRPLVSYCVQLSLENGEARSTSEIYGGQLLATVQTSLPAVFAINSAVLTEQAEIVGRGEWIKCPAPAVLDLLRTRFVNSVEPPSGGVDITKVDRLVCVGRGIGSAENLCFVEELAAALGAEIAASRPVVDAGWVVKARQVGKSGVTVKPKLYFALGVSGAPEHVQGMREAGLIIAVNHDPGAAIFNVAHYGVVADLFDVAEALTELLGKEAQ